MGGGGGLGRRNGWSKGRSNPDRTNYVDSPNTVMVVKCLRGNIFLPHLRYDTDQCLVYCNVVDSRHYLNKPLMFHVPNTILV